MRWILLTLLMTGCVSSSTYRRDIRRVYKDGFRMGRVAGRDEIIFSLQDQQCFQQRIDELMNPDPLFESLLDNTDHSIKP